MIKGIYTTAAGMYPRTLEEEVAANNLANLNTSGFKKDAVHFKEMLDSELALSEQLGINKDLTDVQEVLINFSQGEITSTNNSLDLAIDGDGFFVIDTPDGERYTRNGHFQLDANGELVSAEGHPVLGMSGIIDLQPEEVVISPDGEISQNGTVIDQLKIVDFQRPYPLKKEGQNIFTLTRDVKTKDEPGNFVLRQGFLEESNVNPISEMVKLITISKAFQAGQRAIQDQDRTLEKSVNYIGKY